MPVTERFAPRPGHPPLQNPIRAAVLRALPLAALLFVFCFRLGPALANKSDDAFITLRYSWNLAHHGEFVYNLGDRLLATTSPLSALLYAPLALLFSHAAFPGAVVVLNMLVALCAAILVYLFLRRPAGVPLAFSLAFPLVGFTHAYLFSGLETNLFLFTVILAAMAFLRRRQLAAGALCALGFWVRGDAILLAPLLALSALCSSGRQAWRPLARLALGGVAVLLPTMALCAAYFGTPLPATLATKIYQGKLRMFGDPFFSTILNNGLTELSFYAGLTRFLLVLAAAVFLALLLRPRRVAQAPALRLVMLVAGFGFAQGAAYSVMHVAHYMWYQAPLVLAASWALLVLPSLLAGRVLKPALAHALTLLLLVFLVAINCNFGRDVARGRSPLDVLRQPRLLTWSGELYRSRVEIARGINEVSRPGEAIVVGEVGIYGYYAIDRRMIDYFGVVTPFWTPVLLEGRISWVELAKREMVRRHAAYALSREGSAFYDPRQPVLRKYGIILICKFQ